MMACSPAVNMHIRSGPSVGGTVHSNDSRWIRVTKRSGERVSVEKCDVAEISYSGRGRIISGGIVATVATLVASGAAYSLVEEQRERDRARANGDIYYEDSMPGFPGAEGVLVLAIPVAIVGGVLFGAGLDQNLRAKGRAGSMTCVHAETFHAPPEPPERRRPEPSSPMLPSTR